MDRAVWTQPLLSRARHRARRFVSQHWGMSVVLTLGMMLAGISLPTYPDTWGRLWVGVVGTAIGTAAAAAGVVVWMLASEPFARLADIHALLLQSTHDQPLRLKQFLDDESQTAESLVAQIKAATTAEELAAARQRVVAWAEVLRSALEIYRPGLGNVLLAAAPSLANPALLSQHELANAVGQMAESLRAVHAVAIPGEIGLTRSAPSGGAPETPAAGRR